jgi:soluble lytic murein transglycosylase-like protein
MRAGAQAALLMLAAVAGARAEAAPEPTSGTSPSADVARTSGAPAADGRRNAYLAVITRAAEQAGIPPALADTVAQVESAYDPQAIGAVGEVGLMQVRPQTAAMLGYRGDRDGLFDPETNVRYGVMYLARAWRLAQGDVCRTLMKYRAGHNEERMSAMSAAYCDRARQHLAAIGSPLARAAADVMAMPHARRSTIVGRSIVGSRGGGDPSEAAYRRELSLAQAQARSRRDSRTSDDSNRFWAAHEARIRALTRKLKLTQSRPSAV